MKLESNRTTRTLLLAALLLAHSSFLSPRSCLAQVITTVAGTPWIFQGDGKPATAVPLGGVRGLVVDPAGNVFAADSDGHVVVKIAPTGVLSLVAGNGIKGFSGEGGPATDASLNSPFGLALDSAGNLYIADRLNNRVRRVSPSGLITTVAGTGIAGSSGDGGPAARATLSAPQAVGIDKAGNLLIAGDNRIRKVNPSGIITTLAGTGAPGFSGDGGPAVAAALNVPKGMAVDAAGNLYFAEQGNNRVRRISVEGTISTVAGSGGSGFGNGGYSGDGGPATSAKLWSPMGVALDAAGNLYIADFSNSVIRKVDVRGVITTVAGKGMVAFSGNSTPAANASFGGTTDVAVDSSANFYIADRSGGRIVKVDSRNTATTLAGNGSFKFGGEGGRSTSANLNVPNGVVADGAGNVYLADSFNHRIRFVNAAGQISTVAGAADSTGLGDGGPATSARVKIPFAAALDGAGNMYIADPEDNRVRKVDSRGTITTLAGQGTFGFGGDGGPASAALLDFPTGVAVDSNGNVYIADRENHRIRRVTPAGIITTVAGSGRIGFAGDGGFAIDASFNLPHGVAVDAAGNIYIADLFNHRIRKVDTSGIISTVAGNGIAGFAGDGGLATSALLNSPQGVAVDRVRNLYIADTQNHRVRRVNPSGIITTVAGNGSASFLGDGGPATDAALSSPAGLATDATGNLFIADSGNDRIRKVLATPPVFTVLPVDISITSFAGSETPVTRQVAVTSDVIGLAWSATVSDPWLSVSPATGAVPGVVTVSVDASNLAPGSYRGTVTVQALRASPPTRAVAVTLVVTQGLAPQLTVDPGSVVVEIPLNAGNPSLQNLRITNSGGAGALQWAAQSQVLGPGNWLAILSTSGSASGRAPGRLPVRVNVAGLRPGVYSGFVEVTSSAVGQTQTVPVTVLLSQQTKTILATQSALHFKAVEGSQTTLTQSLGILNTGQGTMDWTVETSTLSGGGWVSATPGTGQSQAGSLDVSIVSVHASPAGLSAGFYSGLVRVNAAGANNSPYVVTVELEVLPAGASSGVQVRPPQLIFTAQAGSSSPSSQTVRLVTPKNSNIEARSGLLTLEDGNWLEALPRNTVVSASDPRTVVVQPTLGNLAPGLHRGVLTFQFNDGSEPQVVEIIFLVVGTTASAASRGEATACTAKQLIAVDRSLGKSFTATAGSAATLEVQVVDDCANAVTDATVVATFSNGDPPVALAGAGAGIYSATWRPVTAAEQVTVMIRANQGSLPVAEVRAQGKVQSNDKAPALFAGGIVNAASFAPNVPLAPGSILSVFGRNLATATTQASALPLPKTLAGATLQIGGIDVPLFFASNGQINAQLPFELQPNTRQQALVKGTSTITLPETITIAPVRPGIFTTDGKQGAVLDTQGRLVDGAAPATPGDIVVVYATGLGAVDRAVATGQAAPADPPAKSTTPVTATIGGQTATVHFAGLTPGFVGLYQVNVQIPAGVTPGAAVPLVILQSGVPSNTVTLAVR